MSPASAALRAPCCLTAKANAPMSHSGAYGTESTAEARPRPQRSLPWGSTMLPPTPAPAGTHLSGGTPELGGGGQGGHRPPRQLAKVAWAPAPRATTHLSRRSRPERPPVARSRPGGSHPQLRRLHGLKLSALKSLHQCLLQCRTMMTQRAPGSDWSSLESAGSGPLVALRAGCVACVHMSECLCG